jgi:UTP--glucose-1-phosphate uridylyltransferase
MKIKKAIIPVAGLGTRMLPATKAIPKEMLTVVDKPLIQYVVHEVVAAGIKEIVLVTHSSKNSIENHFDKSFELEVTLEKRVKRKLLNEVQNICPSDVTIMHVRQGETRGLAHAIKCAHAVVGDEPCAIILPDVLIPSFVASQTDDNLAAMVKNFESTNISQIMVEKVSHQEVSKYGVVAFKESKSFGEGETTEILDLVEKPVDNEAPSDYAIVGRYVLSKEIWKFLEKTPMGVNGEIHLTDSIKLFMEHHQVNAYNIVGRSMDCGNKIGYLKAIVEHALRHEEVKDEFRGFLSDLKLSS